MTSEWDLQRRRVELCRAGHHFSSCRSLFGLQGGIPNVSLHLPSAPMDDEDTCASEDARSLAVVMVDIRWLAGEAPVRLEHRTGLETISTLPNV